MTTGVQQDIMRLVVRGSLELLLHENADMIDIFTEANRPDLIVTLNTFEASFMWLKKQLEAQGYHSAKEIYLGICSSDNKLSLFSVN